ncbi:MAG: UDP-N-acetylmuramoyl-L-alanyl-D-glutamate--2,6-diaminopimelate ligase [Clostridiales bacterium]|nr:UDP-N-acetylmuramoyl-L-alanyl-D-glutamate--2,6-diaminopimelate ligase [Clostridiales bacterium]
MNIRLNNLLHGTDARIICGDGKKKITAVEYDSRKIVPGALFIAVKGFTSDGHDYISKALELGASAIVVDGNRDNYPDEELISMAGDATVIEIRDTRKAMASLSANFYNHPEDRLDLVGVTGTKGKTTITFMIRSILKCAGHDTGLIGTVCNMIGEEKRHSEHTTPESHEIYGLLEEMAEKSFDSCVMEVSSQGLKLDRVYGLRFDCGCFTNLYEDHIAPNEHPDMEDYFNCKMKIFDSSKTAVINSDCERSEDAVAYASERCPVYTFGLTDKSDCYAKNIRKERRNGVTGTVFDLVSPWYEGEIFVALPGKFNVYNALCAICVAGILKIDIDPVREALSTVFVPGRVQSVRNDLDISIIVDYAHNAASLENVVTTLKEYTEGRVITVFGCGGNRSRTRRFEMGEVSGNLSDYTVITSDNPRKEEPVDIIADIVTGIEKTKGLYEIVPDRTEAILRAIEKAKPGDTVLIAGKGHEDYQIFADRTIHFDDCEVASRMASEVLKERK